MPEYTQSGYIIRGKNKQIIADYAKAKGWYLNTLSLAKQKTSSKSKSPKSIKLDPQGGMALTIEAIDYILYIRSGHKQSEYKMPLANFLKALTGMTFDQLEARIADDYSYCVSSFMGDEPSRVLCIEQSIKTLLTHYQGGKKDDELYRLSDVAKYNLLYSAILDSRGIFLGGSSIPRTKKLFSFSYRANGLYLEEDINFQGVKVDKGVLLDLKTLSELDSIELNTLKVSDTKNFFTLRKDVPNTFRALNMTLEEDIDLVDVKLTKGRVLDVVDLKSLNNSNISSILVSYGGRPFTMTREVLTGRLSVSNLIGAIQVYLDFLAGLDLKDDVYGLSNQILRTIDLMAATIIKDNCDTIIQSLVGSSFENDTMDALTKTLNLKPVPTNGILKYAESADSIEVHHAELNNTIQKASKTKKVSKRTTASSVEMTSIQQSQFGILDALEGPESSRLGTVHSLTFFAKMEEDGYLTKAVIKVNNGEIEDELPVFLTASDLEGEYIAEWNETFYNHDENGNKTTKKDKIFCMSSTTFLDVPVSEVRYKQVGPFDNFSISRTQAPYTEHNQLKRLVMSGNHAKQAKTVLHSQRAFVSSGGESLFASEGVIKASELITTFYNTNKDKLNLEQEDLEKLHLKLCTVERITGFKVLTLEVMEFPEEYCSARIPHMQKSSSGSLFSYEINTRTNLVFGWDDIIAANIDIDLGSYESR
jgi:DNA-directed RNA polymerase beta subunit